MRTRSVDTMMKDRSALEELELGKGPFWQEYLGNGEDYPASVPLSTKCPVSPLILVSPQPTALIYLSCV